VPDPLKVRQQPRTIRTPSDHPDIALGFYRSWPEAGVPAPTLSMSVPVAAMATMHEQMHQRATEQQQVGPSAHYMAPMLAQDVERNN